ncbi:MAG: phosphodiester glycosidase family protein [Planktomarina sp.]
MIWRISSLLLALIAGPVAAVECRNAEVSDASYSICDVDVASDQLRLFLNDETGRPFGGFGALPGQVTFAMNAGMFHANRSPVGYHVEQGKTLKTLSTRAGPGNFGMLPNGVFCFDSDTASVMETLAFAKAELDCEFATQSGPMLVIDGQLHPRFFATSDSRNIRNGVGISRDGATLHFVISNQAVNFYDFASVFRDYLNVNNALYFDGRISRLYSPQLNRNDYGVTLGPIIAVVD